MAKSFQPAPDRPVGPTQGARLESWKEIASYLKRDVRTVQRWEKEGLPLHRQVHKMRSTVYVYISELEAWRNSGGGQPEKDEPSQTGLRWRKWTIGFVAIVLAATAGILWSNKRSGPALHERDWVLVTTFQNRTGESLFDGLLESVLASELSESTFVNLVPNERIADTLRLMRRPVDTPLDPVLGREICLRDVGIRVFVTGRIEKLGRTYMLTADLVEPKDATLVARITEQANDQNEILAASHRLSDHLRATMGEALRSIQESNQKLEKVTTPSLQALQFYSQGIAMVNQGEWEAAALLLKEALAEDPQFASAHVYLAHCYSNLGKSEEAAPHFKAAFALVNTTTDRERYFILGSYYQFSHDREKAIEAFKALVNLYPDDYWGNNNLIGLYGPGSEGSLPYILRKAEIRPNDPSDVFQAARALAVADENLAQAEPFVARLKTLLSPPEVARQNAENAFMAVWSELFEGWRAWIHGDPAPLLQGLDRLRRKVDPQSAERRALGAGYLALGRFQDATELLRRGDDPNGRYMGLATIAYAKDDRRELRDELLKCGSFPPPEFSVPLLTRAGLVSEAERELSSVTPSLTLSAAQLTTLRGEVLLARGDPAQAIPLFEKSLQRMDDGRVFLFGSEDLAHAWELEGNLPQAIRVLEEASKGKGRVAMLGLGRSVHIWVHMQGQLAKLYRRVGRDRDADNLETELLRLLTYADSDDPILSQLHQARTLASAGR